MSEVSMGAGPDGSLWPVEFRPFQASVRRGVLSFPRCDACRRYHWYPMKRCPHCLATAISWVAVPAPGSLFTWTVVRHPFSPEHRDQVPYTIGLVEFDEAPGVRLVTTLVDILEPELRCGLPVWPVFPEPDDPDGLPRFRARP